MFKLWPGFLLTLALLVGIVICYRQLDFNVIDEVRAIISIIFGFATSCLLLSFIWIIQKKPTQSSWPTLSRGFGTGTLSMHPAGSTSSDSSLDYTGEINISTISAPNLDHPPNYEDALINSKPIECLQKVPTKIDENLDFSYNEESSTTMNDENISGQVHPEGRYQKNHPIQPRNTSTRTSTVAIPSNSMAQIALSIVRGFTAIEPINLSQQVIHRGPAISRIQNSSHQQNTSEQESQNASDNFQKQSYCQLDVNELILSSSPPRYNELSFHHSSTLSNNSNEPRGGE